MKLNLCLWLIHHYYPVLQSQDVKGTWKKTIAYLYEELTKIHTASQTVEGKTTGFIITEYVSYGRESV